MPPGALFLLITPQDPYSIFKKCSYLVAFELEVFVIVIKLYYFELSLTETSLSNKTVRQRETNLLGC